MADGIELGV